MRHRNRDKAKEEEEQEEMYYSTSSELGCRRHPWASAVGICAQCLKERLVRLVCSDCGEQRLSSCSCSDISSNRNSCSVDAPRISFLLDSRADAADATAAEDKRPAPPPGLRGLRRFFARRRKKGSGRDESGGVEEDGGRNAGVSRSRSLCSFRNGFGNGAFGSGARSSSVTTACGGFLDSGRRSGYSEVEPRKSDNNETFPCGVSELGGFVGNGNGNRRVFSLRESDFGGFDESGFIDLKLDFSAEAKAGFVSESETGFGSMRGGSESFGVDHYGALNSGVVGGGFSRGGSCRITVNDRGVKRGTKRSKGWRWIFRNHTSGRSSGDL